MEDYLVRLFWYMLLSVWVGYFFGFFAGRRSK